MSGLELRMKALVEMELSAHDLLDAGKLPEYEALDRLISAAAQELQVQHIHIREKRSDKYRELRHPKGLHVVRDPIPYEDPGSN